MLSEREAPMVEPSKGKDVAAVAEAYYDSKEADEFYFNIWGGEDIHIGLYRSPKDSIYEASRRTIAELADEINISLGPGSRVIDIGAGYGGSARYLAKRFGCHVLCLNISEIENERNRRANREQGLHELVTVVHGSFENIPEADGSFDVAWSQDAILHSGNRERVISEIARVLKSGGQFVFTDPMQADDVPLDQLKPVFERIHLDSLGSVAFYREAAHKHGLQEVKVRLMTDQLRTHYATVRARLQERYDEMIELSSKEYVDRMLVGLQHWVDAADKGYLAWGILVFRNT